MKGDFTRFTFDPTRHYSSVLMQQGRVQLDADWNESLAINAHLLRTLIRDVVGRSGVPIDMDAFKIKIAPKDKLDPKAADFTILSGSTQDRHGRMYVGGQLCEINEDMTYLTQPDYPFPPPLDFKGLEDGEERADVI